MAQSTTTHSVLSTSSEDKSDTSLPHENTVPYSITMDGVESDLISLGYNLFAVQARHITVQGHNGPIPKRCLSDGTLGAASAEGLAVRNVRYTLCDNGENPLYETYRVAGFECTVTYDRLSSKKLAILAHELGHCIYHDYEQGGEFDSHYRKLRRVASVDQNGLRELIADDFMICQHGLDTNWSGNANYYIRYSVPRPTTEICKQYNLLVDQYLL